MTNSSSPGGGKVLWHFTMSLDGFVAGPDHDMTWMEGVTLRSGLINEYVESTGAILAGRSGLDNSTGDVRPYGGKWQGPIFVLTHHPEDAEAGVGITLLDCSAEEAVKLALQAAGGKNVEVFSADIGRQLLELGLIDELSLHIAPVLLGAGVRLYGNPSSRPIRLHRLAMEDHGAAITVRYTPEQAPS